MNLFKFQEIILHLMEQVGNESGWLNFTYLPIIYRNDTWYIGVIPMTIAELMVEMAYFEVGFILIKLLYIISLYFCVVVLL